MNNFQFIGRLTRDIEIKTSASGKEYSFFTLAINHKGNTAFISITAFGGLARFLATYHKKGDFVAVSGHVEGGTNKENNYKVDFIADEAFFCKNKSNEAGVPDNIPQSDFESFVPITNGELPFNP